MLPGGILYELRGLVAEPRRPPPVSSQHRPVGGLRGQQGDVVRVIRLLKPKSVF